MSENTASQRDSGQPDPHQWDVIVIGGGSAGLSAALMLVRARRRVLVLDAGAPRNRFAAHMHGMLGRDGTSPLALLADGRREIESYGGVVRSASVVRTRRTERGFAVETVDGGTADARKLLVATGARDELPEIPGLAKFWGRGVAVCPYCDGYEVRDRPIGILATGPSGVGQAQLLRQWSPSITYLPNGVGAPTAEEAATLEARCIRVADGAVDRVIGRDGQLVGVGMADGRILELDAIFTAPTLVPLDEPLRQLGAERTEQQWGSFATVDPTGRTSIPGVWAAGNVVTPMANVPYAIGLAALTGGSINHDLILEDVELSLSARGVEVEAVA
ncbi:MAG: NAD(P)/FAD-dependent oxidoreductase [Microbacteriaceae bacterium]